MIESQSSRWCYSTQDCKEYTDHNYRIIDDDDDDDDNDDVDEKIISVVFYFLFCDDCKNYMEFTKNTCHQHLSHRNSITRNYCKNNFRTLNTKEVRCSIYWWSIERKLTKYNIEELKKIVTF